MAEKGEGSTKLKRKRRLADLLEILAATRAKRRRTDSDSAENGSESESGSAEDSEENSSENTSEGTPCEIGSEGIPCELSPSEWITSESASEETSCASTSGEGDSEETSCESTSGEGDSEEVQMYIGMIPLGNRPCMLVDSLRQYTE